MAPLPPPFCDHHFPKSCIKSPSCLQGGQGWGQPGSWAHSSPCGTPGLGEDVPRAGHPQAGGGEGCRTELSCQACLPPASEQEQWSCPWGLCSSLSIPQVLISWAGDHILKRQTLSAHLPSWALPNTAGHSGQKKKQSARCDFARHGNGWCEPSAELWLGFERSKGDLWPLNKALGTNPWGRRCGHSAELGGP